MRKLTYKFCQIGAFILTLQSVLAWTPSGPVGNAGDAWQTLSLSYGYHDPVAPKDLNEEYRRVTPVMYYASDATFLNYFGTPGLTNVDAAFAILNGVLCGQTNSPVYLYSPTNGIYLNPAGVPTGQSVGLTAKNSLDSYSSDLSEFPLEALQINYTAQTLGLADMKSVILHLMVNEIGLADPTRYVWTLRDRLSTPGVQNPKCPQDEEYFVFMRNFDVNPFQNFPYSAYINNVFYTYYIYEDCGDHTSYPYDAATRPVPADIFADDSSPVAAGGLLQYSIDPGYFYFGLTRDDVAGFRYLLSTNNINWEATSPSGVQLFTIATNYTVTPQVFPPYVGSSSNVVSGTNGGYYVYSGGTNGGYGYGDLGAFIAFTKTNGPDAVQAAYPGVVISSYSYTVTIASNATYNSYYTNAPVGSPYGSPPRFVVVTNYTPYFQLLYSYKFANIVTNHFYTNTTATWQTVTASAPVGSTYGTAAITNATIKYTNQIAGDFFVLPQFYTGVCPIDILPYGSIQTVLAYTNYLTGAGTNVTTPTNTIAYSTTVYLVTYFTNYSYLIQPVNCAVSATNSPALRRGIGRIQFVRANYDSLLGQLFQPLTNNYSMVAIANSQQQTELYQRVVTQPDFVMSAQDLTYPTLDYPHGRDLDITSPAFDQSTILNGLAGPGTILPTPTTFTFNKNENGTLYINGSLNELNLSTNEFLNFYTQTPVVAWGAYDGTTNYPVVYPSNISITNLANQMLIQVSPSAVPDGTNGVNYNVTFSAAGGQTPYIWAMPDISTLVPGLSFDSSSATLSGRPTASGVFTFTLQLTDAANRVVSLGYAITIH